MVEDSKRRRHPESWEQPAYWEMKKSDSRRTHKGFEATCDGAVGRRNTAERVAVVALRGMNDLTTLETQEPQLEKVALDNEGVAPWRLHLAKGAVMKMQQPDWAAAMAESAAPSTAASRARFSRHHDRHPRTEEQQRKEHMNEEGTDLLWGWADIAAAVARHMHQAGATERQREAAARTHRTFAEVAFLRARRYAPAQTPESAQTRE